MNELTLEKSTPHLYGFVERGDTELPGDYLPEAPGVIFPGEAVLSAAGYVAGSKRPHGWHMLRPGNYRKYVGKHVLMVRQCGGPRSEHWTIERLDEFNTEALVLPFGPAPIFARNYQSAMRLAEHCYRSVDLPIPARWVVARLRQ
jgi:hypothetical protein